MSLDTTLIITVSEGESPDCPGLHTRHSSQSHLMFKSGVGAISKVRIKMVIYSFMSKMDVIGYERKMTRSERQRGVHKEWIQCGVGGEHVK